MRKPLLILSVLGCVIGLAMTASADVRKGEFLIAPEGSFGLPLGDYPSPAVDEFDFELGFGQNIEPGFALGGNISRVITTNFALGAQFGINFMGVNDDEIARIIEEHQVGEIDVTPDFSWKTVRFGGYARRFFNPESRTSPFVHLGAGVFLNKAEADILLSTQAGSSEHVPISESSTDLGVSLGAGTLVRISKDVRLSLDAILNNVFTDEKSVRYVNFTLGMVIGVMPQQ